MYRLSPEQISSFQSVRDRLAPEARDWVDAVSIEAIEGAHFAARHWNFDLPGHAVLETFGPDATADLQRGLIATWGLEMPARIDAENLPDEILELYPFWIDKLAEWLMAQEGDYDPDFWAKDVRLVLVLSVPGSKTQSIDLTTPLGPGQIVRHALGGRGLGPLWAYAKVQGWRRTWLQTHTEARHTDDFNEAGWDRLWMSAGALCLSRPDVAGMIGASWFFDPPLETISPRLAYLRVNPLKGGAFLVHQGPGDIHSERAGATSPTRRALIESGDYVPHSWLLAWPRNTLIPWRQGRMKPSGSAGHD